MEDLRAEVEALKQRAALAEEKAGEMFYGAHRRIQECNELRAEVRRLKEILHDAETTPLAEIASTIAALRENVAGTAALLHEAEAREAAHLARLATIERLVGDGELCLHCTERVNAALSEEPCT